MVKKEYIFLIAKEVANWGASPEPLSKEVANWGASPEPLSSKIVATINPDFPVWDSEVLRRLGLKAPPYNLNKEARLKKTIQVYEEINNWYSDFLVTDQAKNMINTFDGRVGNIDITDLKKIDLILWQTRS